MDEGETSSCQETRLHRTNENSFNKLKQKKKKSSQEPRGRSPPLGNVSSLTLKMGGWGSEVMQQHMEDRREPLDLKVRAGKVKETLQ